MFESGLAFLGFLFVLIVTLLGAYFTTQWLGNRILGPSQPGSGLKLKLVQRLSLGREQHLAVVQLGERHVLIGCTNQNISFLSDLTPEESAEYFSQEEKIQQNSTFVDVLSRLKNEKEKNEPTKKTKD